MTTETDMLNSLLQKDADEISIDVLMRKFQMFKGRHESVAPVRKTKAQIKTQQREAALEYFVDDMRNTAGKKGRMLFCERVDVYAHSTPGNQKIMQHAELNLFEGNLLKAKGLENTEKLDRLCYICALLTQNKTDMSEMRINSDKLNYIVSHAAPMTTDIAQRSPKMAKAVDHYIRLPEGDDEKALQDVTLMLWATRMNVADKLQYAVTEILGRHYDGVEGVTLESNMSKVRNLVGDYLPEAPKRFIPSTPQ